MSIDKVSLSQFNDVGYHSQNKKENEELNPVEKTVVCSVAPARRIYDIPGMLQSGDTLAAVGLGALTLVSLPEDCRDLRAAYNHSACVLKKRKISAPYNYHKYQHDFSFFRGTLLHELMKRVKSERGKKIVDKLYKSDVTLYNTKFGKWVQKLLGLENGNSVKSKVKDLYGNEVFVKRINVKKDFCGLKELTGRAMKRTSLLGILFMGALELPKIIKSSFKGDDIKEKSKSFAKQFGKSSMNVLGVTIGMGYIGAIGAKKYGALGSLVGMGLGVIAGAGTSKWIQKQFKSEN